MSYVECRVRVPAPHLNRKALVVGKSTVPAGTAVQMQALLRELAPSEEVELAWNPEFLREGFAVEDTLHPDRLVFGVQSPSGPSSSCVPPSRRRSTAARRSSSPTSRRPSW